MQDNKPKSKCCRYPMYAKNMDTRELVIWCSHCNNLLDSNGDNTFISLDTLHWPGVLERYKGIDRQRSDYRQSRYMSYDYRNYRHKHNPDPWRSYEYNGIPLLGIFEPSHYKMITKNERDQTKTRNTFYPVSNTDRASIQHLRSVWYSVTPGRN